MKLTREKETEGTAHGKRRATGRAGQRLSDFARRLLAEWKHLDLPLEGERVVIAVSGGADSAALMLAIEELHRAGRLALRVAAAHLDHGLRGEAGAADACWVSELASAIGFESELGRASVKEMADARRDNLEQAARRARYEFLSRTAARLGARLVLTAHTLDDQAETVMLRLMRGSGAEGLGGIEPVRSFDKESDALLARPLLGWARRSETEEYCRRRGVLFRVDEMNLNERFARVRVRRSLLPLMQTFNGRIVETLARTAELLREDAAALAPEAEKLLAAASLKSESERRASDGFSGQGAPSVVPELSVNILARAPKALRRRALRRWIAEGRGDLRRLEMVHLLAVEKLVEGERGGRKVLLPGGAIVSRQKGRLRLRPAADDKRG
jgi:tRNA(Ile)-lysidine synthase